MGKEREGCSCVSWRDKRVGGLRLWQIRREGTVTFKYVLVRLKIIIDVFKVTALGVIVGS